MLRDNCDPQMRTVMVFLMLNSQPDAEEKKISTLMDTKNMMDINVILEYYGVW